MEPKLSEGLLLIDKPAQKSSFYLVYLLRKITKISKIGHAGTLDPFATGLMVMLVGKSATRQQSLFLNCDKEYRVTIQLGSATTTYDTEGELTHASSRIPSSSEVEEVLETFQGTTLQTPPMFSAKKINGQKLYELARKGQEIERAPNEVRMQCTLLSYTYPHIELLVTCSKGTYIRSLAHDLGLKLGTYAHATGLVRTKSGPFSLEQALTVEQITAEGFDYQNHLFQCKSSTPLMPSHICLHQ